VLAQAANPMAIAAHATAPVVNFDNCISMSVLLLVSRQFRRT